jgi:hypothetical protein
MSATPDVAEPSTDEPSTDLDSLVRTAIQKVNEGSLTMSALLKALSPRPAEVAPPAQAPMPVAITDEQRRAVERVGEVFGRVVPTERRALQPAEVTALVEEKETLDALKKMAESRQESLRTTIFNHLDVEAEGSEDFDADDLGRDARGHYTAKGEVRGTPGTAKKFTREVREGAPTLDSEALKALVEDPEVAFTHEDYLAMTTQIRVVDENKVMLALKKNPALVHAVARATRPGSRTASLNLRKA